MDRPEDSAAENTEFERLLDELVSGDRRLHELPAELPASEAARIRRIALERKLGVSLARTGEYTLDAGRAASRHCENFIGAAQIPIGITGPLSVRGRYVAPDEELYVPLATTEGALIASTNRGCRAIREAGGAVVRVEDVGMTRAPVFRSRGIEDTQRFLHWVDENQDRIREITESTSNHLELLEIRSQVFGSSIYLRFRFRTGDAMGMNMATVACDRVIRDLIEPETGLPCLALSGNFCVDKKPSAINFLEGRGKRVWAEVELSGDILEGSLRTSARDLVEVQYRKNLLGSIAAGSMGYNAHFANILAAFFIATGQDVAQVVEGSMGVTTIEARGEDGVIAAVYMPDLPLGAVGGGTALDTQAEALAMIGVSPGAGPRAGEKGAAAMRLAEIVGATVLAGELSLLAAFTSSDLARAHQELGRGPVQE
ncbi:MAG: hydroxymethylglutaryl-CoA reductase (NADPH) [Acidobacteria bacterium]|nr:hydroxymethylglutaryl-CoA reductase (NADPH) [Acidobacteriota bacterium]